jgi:hypothetical protein
MELDWDYLLCSRRWKATTECSLSGAARVAELTLSSAFQKYFNTLRAKNYPILGIEKNQLFGESIIIDLLFNWSA